jgi:cytochrome c5
MNSRWLLGAALALAACDRAPPQQSAPAPAADPNLGTLYVQTCMACHTSPGSGAPQAGDREAWKPRLSQGMDVLLDHAIDGYRGMPPLGSCMDCTAEQFEQLIRFMAGANE